METGIELMRLRRDEYKAEEDLYKMNTDKICRSYHRGVFDSDRKPKENSGLNLYCYWSYFWCLTFL